jgi:hypothetical protein
MKHFCSEHQLPQSHACVNCGERANVRNELQHADAITSHEELPYFIHARSNVPYLVGRMGHTVIALELKRFGWKIGLKRNNNSKDIIAYRGDQKWHIMVKSNDAKLAEVLHNIPIGEEELAMLKREAEHENALPVIALVCSDSAVLLSARTFMALSSKL